MVFGALLKTFVPLAFVLPGLLGLGLFGDRPGLEPNAVYPELIRELLPIGLRGLLYAAFLAALMSSVDSYTNSAATIVVRDLYQRLWAHDRDDAHYLRLGRAVSLGIIGAGVVMVPAVAAHRTIYDAFQTYLSFFQGPTLALLLFGLLGRWATPAGGLAALLFGVATSTWMHLEGGFHFLHAAWWSFCAATTALIAVSAKTRGLPDPQLETLVFDWSRQDPR
jgi:SSS family solute:Na+ symporter